MDLKLFNIANFPELDNGRPASAVDAELATVLRDMFDRPHEKKPRKVTIEMTFAPTVENKTGALEDIIMGLAIKSVVPPQKSPTYTLTPNRKGMAFSPHNRDARQTTVMDADQQKGGK